MIWIPHGSVAIAMGKHPLHAAEKPSQTQNISFHRTRIKKTHVATSSCNWETEQQLKRCRRPKLNPTGIAHSLWKRRFYHEIIKARIANSWCARSTTQPVLLVLRVPWSRSGSSLSQMSPSASAASLQGCNPSSCWTFPKHRLQALPWNTVRNTKKDSCACPHHTWLGHVTWQLQLTDTTEETTNFQRLCKLHKMQRCWRREHTRAEPGANHGTAPEREKWPKTLKCQVQEAQSSSRGHQPLSVPARWILSAVMKKQLSLLLISICTCVCANQPNWNTGTSAC